jgi:hypothetical protein
VAGRPEDVNRYFPYFMAVAPVSDYGVFIDGEAAEPASGVLRDLVEAAPKPFNPFGL